MRGRREERSACMKITKEMLIFFLIGINVLGFVLQGIDVLLRRRGSKLRLDTPVMIASVLGASPGILLCMLLFDRMQNPEATRRVIKLDSRSEIF